MVTKRIPGAKMGRPRVYPVVVRGDKPGPVPMPFVEDPARYEVAKFQALLLSGKNSARLFAMFKFGDPVSDVPARLKKCTPGWINILFPPPLVTMEGTSRNIARVQPDSAVHWPKFVEGGEQTLRRKIKSVMHGNDQEAKDWLSHMSLAWLFPLFVAMKIRIDDKKMFRDALKMAAVARAREVGEEDYATRVIAPAVDLMLPMEDFPN